MVHKYTRKTQQAYTPKQLQSTLSSAIKNKEMNITKASLLTTTAYLQHLCLIGYLDRGCETTAVLLFTSQSLSQVCGIYRDLWIYRVFVYQKFC